LRIKLDSFSERHRQRITDILAGTLVPPVPRDAATVMVLREASGDLEVLMMRRPAAMKFAPGAFVFPGGSVDASDAAPEIGWYGPDPEEFGARLSASAELARALVCAAVRETFEESGVLLAGPADGGALTPVFDSTVPGSTPSGPSWQADRAALIAGELTLAALLASRGLVIRADLLIPWTRWITPEGESRRFDARFFVAALPPGQRPTGHAAEADEVAWLRPADAIAAARAGDMSLLPPTATTLNEFAAVAAAGGGVADLLAMRRTIEPICPRLVVEDGETWLVVPDEVEYPL
jgi:8-oxo-dGTP pyrophosphatase MutT (NUDIX family)